MAYYQQISNSGHKAVARVLLVEDKAGTIVNLSIKTLLWHSQSIGTLSAKFLKISKFLANNKIICNV